MLATWLVSEAALPGLGFWRGARSCDVRLLGGGVPRQEQVPPVPGQMLSCSCELSPPALGGPTLGAGEVRLGLGSGLGLFRAGWVGPLTHLGLQGLQSTCPGPSWSPSPPTVLHPYVASPPPFLPKMSSLALRYFWCGSAWGYSPLSVPVYISILGRVGPTL